MPRIVLSTCAFALLSLLPGTSTAAIVSISNTTKGLEWPWTTWTSWTTDYTLAFNDADENLVLTPAELLGMSWVRTAEGLTYSGTSLPRPGTHYDGIEFVVSETLELLSASDDAYIFDLDGHQLGIGGSGVGWSHINYFGSCTVGCGPYAHLDTFTVTIAPDLAAAITPVPLPASLPLFGLALAGLLGWSRRGGRQGALAT